MLHTEQWYLTRSCYRFFLFSSSFLIIISLYNGLFVRSAFIFLQSVYQAPHSHYVYLLFSHYLFFSDALIYILECVLPDLKFHHIFAASKSLDGMSLSFISQTLIFFHSFLVVCERPWHLLPMHTAPPSQVERHKIISLLIIIYRVT